MLNAAEIAVLRQLASEYAQAASLGGQGERRRRWLNLNHLRGERPLVLIDQIPWEEMDVDGSLDCQVRDPYWRGVETNLRQTLYKWRHRPADMVLDPYICLPRPICSSGWGIGVEETLAFSSPETEVKSHHYINQIREPEDIAKIRTPQITLDAAEEAAIVETARRVFEGILPFRMVGMTMHLGIWDSISMWMGVENCYLELMDRPEMMHQLMETLTRGLIDMVGQLNALQAFDIHSHICHCSHTYLEDLPASEEAVSANAWAFGLAQLFTSVSPAITDEFEVAYMRRVFPLFGAIYYGCCDRLDDRLDVIEKLPQVRKISCSPWSDRERFAANLDRKRYVMSNKPSPAFLATPSLDEDAIRADLRRTIRAAREHDVCLEIILKDISTVCRRPQNLWRWQEIAMEEAQR